MDGEAPTKGFTELQSISDLAEWLEIELCDLEKILRAKSRRHLYRIEFRSKKSGGVRVLHKPRKRLKALQSRLAKTLAEVYTPASAAHGYVRNRNIASGAKPHVRPTTLLNIDLEDFFPSITTRRVRRAFKKHFFRDHPELADALAKICCVSNQLPQGAPTSPVISNLVCYRLDRDLSRLAARFGCEYTRYSDDGSFSTRHGTFPRQLARRSRGPNGGRVRLGSQLVSAIERNDVRVNKRKIRLTGANHCQQVTGLVVNEKLNVRRKQIRQVRAMLHAWRKFGRHRASEHFCRRYDPKKRAHVDFSKVVKGRIEHIGMVRGRDDALYRRLLGQWKSLAEEASRW